MRARQLADARRAAGRPRRPARRPVVERLLRRPRNVERRGDDEIVFARPEAGIAPVEMRRADLGGGEQQPPRAAPPRHHAALGIPAAVLACGQAFVDRLAAEIDEAHAIDIRHRLIIIARPHHPRGDQRLCQITPPFRRLPQRDGEPGEAQQLSLDEELCHIEMQPVAAAPPARNPDQFGLVTVKTAPHHMDHAGE